MNYSYRLTRMAVYCASACALLLGGCSRIEKMAEEHDKEANIRLAVRDIAKQMEKAEKGLRKLEDFARKKLR